MTRPSRDPHYYSDSTIRWPCSFCSKPCKSKAGRLQHIRAMHASLLPLDEPESSNAANWEINSESPQSPLQTLHHLRQSYSPPASSHAGSGRNTGDQFEDIDLPNLNNINSLPVLSMFSNKSLIQNSEFVLDETARDDGLISTSKTDTSMSDTASDSNFQACKCKVSLTVSLKMHQSCLWSRLISEKSSTTWMC